MARQANVAICAAYEMGVKLISKVLAESYPVKFVATCIRDTTGDEKKIANLCAQNGVQCYRQISANDPEFIKKLKENDIDLVFMLWWPEIVKKDAIQAAKIGWVNLHTSLLPYNRGMHPYYWAIVDGTPFGATLHLINEGIDSGPILFQKELTIDITDTGDSLYKKLIQTCLDLFSESYPKILRFDFKPKPQANDRATFHWAKDINPHSTIDLEKTYKARDLINIIRARTFWGRPSGFFFHEGKKYWVRLQIEEARE